MKFQVKQLKDFMQLASPIVNKGILGIHNYIKLTEDGCLEKTNGEVFISHKIDAAPTDAFLIEEAELNAIVKLTKSKEIEVSIKGKKVHLSDGVLKKDFQTESVKNFDKLIPDGEVSNEYEMDYEVLEAIGIANSCVGKVGGNANIDFVHLSNGFVIGTDTFKFYAKKIKDAPNVFLSAESAAVISKFNAVSFYQQSNFNLFKIGNTLYGFKQHGDVSTPNTTPHFNNKFKEGDDYFEFNTADLLYFCDSVTMTNNTPAIPICILNGNKLSYNNKEVDKTTEMDITSKGNAKPVFWFNPKIVSSYIRSLGKETLRFFPFKSHVYVGDENEHDFFGMLAGLAQQDTVIYKQK